MRHLILLGMTLVVVTLAVYWQVGNHEFINYDDESYVIENVHVNTGITTDNIIWAFTSPYLANWHPITWLSHMADVQIYGMNPRGHHLTNVLIHAASTLLLFALLFRLTNAPWQSSFVAALFSLHPLHVESVAWVAERKDVLCALFWFLTIYLYAEYVQKRKPSLYLLALFCFVLGLMSKPMLVTLPVILLLMDYWPLNRYMTSENHLDNKKNISLFLSFIKEKIPFFAFSFFSSIITIYSQKAFGAVQSLDMLPLESRVANATIAYVKYLYKTIWPTDLAIPYPLSSSISTWQFIGSLLVLLAITLVAIWTRKRHPHFFVGWLWFLISLLPVIGIIQVGAQAMADRYTYLPLTGLFIAVAWGMSALAERFSWHRGVLALTAVAVITLSTALTWEQLTYWKDSASLFQHAVQVTAGNFVAHNNLGRALAAQGHLERAVHEYQKSLEIRPKFPEPHVKIGDILVETGNIDAAIQEYRKAIRIDPKYKEAYNNLGLALEQKGRKNEAMEAYRKALAIDQNSAEAHNNLGIILADMGRYDESIIEFQKSLSINPGQIGIRKNLEIALELKKKSQTNPSQ